MKLDKLYLKYENEIVEKFFNRILERFKTEQKALYIDKDLNPKESEFLELKNIDYPSQYMKVYRRFDNPEEWKVSFEELRNAIKYTIRRGAILGSGDYNKMTGTSNFVGTPLRTLIALISNDDYKKYSLVNKFLTHPKFGTVEIKGLDFKDDFINIEVENAIKKIKMDYWEINAEMFEEITSGK